MLRAAALALVLFWFPTPVRAECYRIEITWYSPTGVAGCETYGEGWASWYAGPGVARNDCVHPWTDCQPITITSLDTGLAISVVPRMYCDCYSETSNERLVDLDPATLKALGLWEMRSQGLFRVQVQPVRSSGSTTLLPDTALAH